MATDKPIKFDTESLNALGARLVDHADGIEFITLHNLEQDIRLAARVCDKLASLRFRVAEISTCASRRIPVRRTVI
jgi:hypothetical protein